MSLQLVKIRWRSCTADRLVSV